MFLNFLPIEDHSDISSADLKVLEFDSLPFSPQRIYWLSNFVPGQKRGKHAHKTLTQAMKMIKGSLKMNLRRGCDVSEFQFDMGDGWLIVPPGCWREMSDASADAILLVVADKKFDEQDYIRDWDEYLDWFAINGIIL